MKRKKQICEKSDKYKYFYFFVSFYKHNNLYYVHNQNNIFLCIYSDIIIII